MSDLWLALCRAFYTLPARQLWGRVLLCIGLLSSIWLLVAGVGLAWERYTLRRHLVQGGQSGWPCCEFTLWLSRRNTG